MYGYAWLAQAQGYNFKLGNQCNPGCTYCIKDALSRHYLRNWWRLNRDN
jgi:hypothetical protein